MPVLQGSLPTETPTVPWRALFFSRFVKEGHLQSLESFMHHLQSILLSPIFWLTGGQSLRDELM